MQPPHWNLQTMPKRKNDGILPLNVKKLLILHLVWKTNRILQYGSLFFVIWLILVRIWRDNLPKCARKITLSPFSVPYLLQVFIQNTFQFINLTVKFNKIRAQKNILLKNIFYFAITHLILNISRFLLPTATTLKLR